jgi:hypothetical protein
VLGLTLGQGEFAYEETSDGDPFNIVFGPQGGFHVDLAGITSGSSNLVGLLPNISRVSDGTQLAGIGQENDAPVLLAGYDEATCTGTFFKARAFMDDYDWGGDMWPYMCAVHGEQLDFCLEATDLASGQAVTDCRVGIAQLTDTALTTCAAL